MRGDFRKVTWLLVLFLWLAGISAAYFVIHKPITVALTRTLSGALLQIGVVFGIISVCGGLGSRLLPWLPFRPAVQLALQAAFGLGLLAITVLAAGSLLGVSVWVMVSLLLLLAALLRKDIAGWLRKWKDVTLIWRAGGRLARWISVPLGLILLLSLLVSLAPALKFDALVYHLVLPKAYLQAGRILYLPWIMYWGMPQTAELNYMTAMVVAGDQAAALMGWAVGVLALVGLLGYVAQRLGSPAAWTSLASLLAGSTLAVSLSWAYVGWWTVLHGLAVLAMMEQWRISGRQRDLILAGLFCGLAVATKYTAGGLLIAAAVFVLWHAGHRSPAKGRPGLIWRALLTLGLAALLASAPWWLKNVLATGNPFYPFLFPSGAMDPHRLALYQEQPPEGSLLQVLMLPMYATVLGLEGAPGPGASIGPLLLGFGAVFWIGWRRRPADQQRTLSASLLFALAGLGLWAVMSRLSGLLIQTRLYLSFFPAFAVLAGSGFDGLSRLRVPGVRLGRIAAALLIIVLGLNAARTTVESLQGDLVQLALGQTDPRQYLQRNLGMYAIAMQALEELPPGSKTLMLWEPRSYYCLPACAPDEVLDRWSADLNRWGSSDAVVSAWRAQGFTHLLYYRTGAELFRGDPRFPPPIWQQLDQLLSGLPIHTDFDQIYILYRLSP